MIFESVLCMETVKSRFFKNIWKEENHGGCFICPLVGYNQCIQIIENCNFVGAEAHKMGK